MATVERVTFFTARTSYGSSSVVQLKPGYRDYTLLVTGVFNGATVTLEGSSDNSTFSALGSSTTVTVVGQVNFQTAVPYLRATVSAVGGSTSLTIAIFS